VTRDRLVLNYSHNHSAPVTGQVLHLYYDPHRGSEGKGSMRTLAGWWIVWLRSLAIRAQSRSGKTLVQSGAGRNRRSTARRARPGGRSLPGPVDQDVPVLSVRDSGGRKLRAILFGYSCHTTRALGIQIGGDYAGVAQQQLEKMHPSATALFVQGCARRRKSATPAHEQLFT